MTKRNDRRLDNDLQSLPQDSELAQRLAALNRVTMELARSASVDDLCHNAVNLGINELGFDRLGLFFVDSEAPDCLMGTYGTNHLGQVVDEYAFTCELAPGHWLLKLVDTAQLTYHIVELDIELYSPSTKMGVEEVGQGWNAGAVLWNGQAIIGYLIADNLRHHRTYTDFDGELLALYAGTIGHLCLRLQTEESLRASHQTEQDFRTRLATLNHVAAKLMTAADLDSLYRQVVERGRAELGFDRLGLWLMNEERTVLHGTYGTWVDGSLKEEYHLEFGPEIFEDKLQNSEEQRHNTGVVSGPVGTPETNFVNDGWSAVAVLKNGEETIGYLSTDNLLQQRPYRAIDGELLGAYAHIIGPLIARQKIAEQLRARQANYHALVNAIPDMLFVLTADGVYCEYYAPSSEELYAPPEYFLGKHVKDVLPTPLAEQVMTALEDAMTSGQLATIEYTLPLEGKEHAYDARMVPLDANHCLTLVRDLTDRKRLEEQLIVAQKMESLGRMASGIAHDFNNLLTVVEGYASLGVSQVPAEQELLRRSLTKVLDAADKGMHLTRQLLSFARKEVVMPKTLNVCTQLHEMTSMIRQLMGDEITMQIETPDVPLYITFDPSQFDQIILNLSINARDAMHKGDTFTLSCQGMTKAQLTNSGRFPIELLSKSTADNFVLITARDTGMGMEATLLQQIFEPFFTTKPGEKGSGLGLAICHSIVHQNGGYIDVESKPNMGTVFRIYLPTVDAVDFPSESLRNEDHTTGDATIVIVEDDDIICKMTTEILTGCGYTTLAYSSALEALDYVKTSVGPIHLLLTDMMMPEMNGQELAEAVLQIFPNLPVLIVSGYVGKLPEQFLNQTNVHFLMKPYRSNELAEAVHNALQGDLLKPSRAHHHPHQQ